MTGPSSNLRGGHTAHPGAHHPNPQEQHVDRSEPTAVLRALTKEALKTAGISQAEAARRLDLSTKHMSHMLTGRATLTLDWADRILALCGAHLVITAIQEQPAAPGPRIALDHLTSDQLDQLYDERDKAKRAVDLLAEQDRALEQRVTELTAGQCTHTRRMCDLHHRLPVADCPYPRCIAARTQEADL